MSCGLSSGHFVARGYLRAKTLMRDAEVEDQAPASSLVSQVVPNFHVAAPLACACRYPMLGAHRVSSRAEERPKPSHETVACLGCT
jgi:hypothetical protein